MATFGSLKSAIADQIIRSDLDSQIGRVINQAITYYNQRYALWFTADSDSTTMTVGSRTMPSLPTSWGFERPDVAFVIVRDQTNYPLMKVSLAQLEAMETQINGFTQFYAFTGEDYINYPYPDTAYTLRRYWQKSYAELSGDSDTNDWLNYAERLIEAKALADLYLKYRHEPETAAIYQQVATDELTQLLAANNAREASGILNTAPIINQGDYYDQPTYC